MFTVAGGELNPRSGPDLAPVWPWSGGAAGGAVGGAAGGGAGAGAPIKNTPRFRSATRTPPRPRETSHWAFAARAAIG